jgi:hypothetical protein
MLGQEGANVAASTLLSEKPPERIKTLRRRDDLEEPRTRRRIEGQLHHFCDLEQALHEDGRSKKAEYNSRVGARFVSRREAK